MHAKKNLFLNLFVEIHILKNILFRNRTFLQIIKNHFLKKENPTFLLVKYLTLIKHYVVILTLLYTYSESEFNEFEPRLKSAKNRCQLSTGLNLETLITILSGNNHT